MNLSTGIVGKVVFDLSDTCKLNFFSWQRKCNEKRQKTAYKPPIIISVAFCVKQNVIFVKQKYFLRRFNCQIILYMIKYKK